MSVQKQSTPQLENVFFRSNLRGDRSARRRGAFFPITTPLKDRYQQINTVMIFRINFLYVKFMKRM